jgi:uncharacterized protein YdaU (DUF1376 family)
MKPLTPEHVAMLKEICKLAETVNKPPAFQFYVQDWLGSSTILAMRPSQEGAYLRLMCCCWDNPKLAIPDDADKLAMMSRLNGEWEKSGPSVRDCFTEHPVLGAGWLTNVRLIEVRHHQLTKQLQSREANEIKARKTPGGTPDAPPDGHPGGSPGVPPLPGFRASGFPDSQTDELSSSQADKRKRPQPSADGLALAQFLHDSLVRALPGIPESKLAGKELDRRLQHWAAEFERFGRIDLVTNTEYRSIIAWALADEFWRQNIHSPGALRTRKRDHDAKVWIDFRTRSGKGVNLGHYGTD